MTRLVVEAPERVLIDFALTAKQGSAGRLDRGEGSLTDGAVLQLGQAIVESVARGRGEGDASPVSTPVDMTGDLLRQLEDIAVEDYDGHLTIMRFTWGWKVMFGTPIIDHLSRAEVEDLQSHVSLNTALKDRLEHPNEVANIGDLLRRATQDMEEMEGQHLPTFRLKHLDRASRRDREIRRTIEAGLRAGQAFAGKRT